MRGARLALEGRLEQHIFVLPFPRIEHARQVWTQRGQIFEHLSFAPHMIAGRFRQPQFDISQSLAVAPHHLDGELTIFAGHAQQHGECRVALSGDVGDQSGKAQRLAHVQRVHGPAAPAGLDDLRQQALPQPRTESIRRVDAKAFERGAAIAQRKQIARILPRGQYREAMPHGIAVRRPAAGETFQRCF